MSTWCRHADEAVPRLSPCSSSANPCRVPHCLILYSANARLSCTCSRRPTTGAISLLLPPADAKIRRTVMPHDVSSLFVALRFVATSAMQSPAGSNLFPRSLPPLPLPPASCSGSALASSQPTQSQGEASDERKTSADSGPLYVCA